MAYKVIILYQLYMPSYFLGTFTEYPSLKAPKYQVGTKAGNYRLPYVSGIYHFIIFICFNAFFVTLILDEIKSSTFNPSVGITFVAKK